MTSDVNLKTPAKLPGSPTHWYPVRRDLSVDVTPTATTRRKVIYTWRVMYKDNSHKDYTGKTVQSLIERTEQHTRKARKSVSHKDLFHYSLKEFAANLPNSQIAAVNLGISRIVPPNESLSKTEQIYISAKQTCIQDGGLNQINANAALRDRIDGVQRNLMIDFQNATGSEPSQIEVHHV